MTEGRRWRYWLILAIAAASVLGLALHKAIPQDPSYHRFADQRMMLGIPNFWNVVSSFPFLIVGIAGLLALRKAQPLFSEYATFFVGAILIFFGSSYYHLNPNNDTLAWDRLPMTIAFMSFVAIVVGEHFSPQLGRRSLPLLLLLGVSSVIYWRFTELRGHGDLRPYALVQFLPMPLIPLTMLLFPSTWSKVCLIWATLGAYAVAKVFELLDRRIYLVLGVLSGHTLKHLTAAAGMYFLVLAVQRRRPVMINTSSGA